MRLLTVGLALALAAAVGSFLVLGSHRAAASAPGPTLSQGLRQGGCAAVPHSCGFPDATNTGVPSGTTLKTVPGQVSSGPGWSYNSTDNEVDVTGDEAVLAGLSFHCGVDISASNVTIKDDRIVTGGNFAISLRHTVGVTIEDSTVSGQNATTGRVGSAIDDIYGDSTGMVIQYDNISAFKTGVQVSTGLVSRNYIHDFGYVPGDHTNGIFVNGTTEPLMIYQNTILNSRGQTDAISLDASAVGHPVADKTIEDNLLSGGSYTIYGGAARNNSTWNIVIDDNWFSQAYYPHGGQYGPVAYFAPGGSGNAWSGNAWVGSGRVVPAP